MDKGHLFFSMNFHLGTHMECMKNPLVGLSVLMRSTLMGITKNKKKDIVPFTMAISLALCFIEIFLRYFSVLIWRMTLQNFKANSNFVRLIMNQNK